MRNSTRTKAIVAVLVAGALTPVAPAVASFEDPFVSDLGGSSSGDSSSIVQRRDATQAAPFVAEVGPEATTVANDDFEWGSAAIGAGAALLTVALVGLGTGAIRERGGHAHRSAPSTTQSA